MTRRLVSVGCLVLLALSTHGCRRISKRTLKDTEGRRFQAECDREQRCKLQQDEGPDAPAGKPALKLQTRGWLVGICNVADADATPDAADCRPLTCESNEDCPPAHGDKDGDCLNGWCTDPANPVSVEDSVMLCLAGTGLGKVSERQHQLYAMALNCGKPCKVPKTCKQP